jgi:poly(3-hydroxybutyrate) depolymerase
MMMWVALLLWDIVTLKGGQKLEGRVISENDAAVVIRTPQGEKKVPRAKVDQVKKCKSIYDTFDAKLADAKDVKALLQVAAWANSNRLFPEAIAAYRRVLDLDPNNAAAKKATEEFDAQPVGSGGSGGAPGDSDRNVKGRPYFLHVPKTYAGQPTPVLIWLHGDGGERRTCTDGITQLADKYGYIVIGGEGANRTWKDFKSDKGCEDDEYLMACLDEVKRQYNVDLVRIFLGGHSRGATYTSRMGADYNEVFAAGGMHNGVWITQQGATFKRRTPFFIYHGEKDYLAKEYGFGWLRAEPEGHEVKRHTIAGAGHEPYISAYEEMFRWFKTKTLPKSMLWDLSK